MNATEWKQEVMERFPEVPPPFATDTEYCIGVTTTEMRIWWKRWKYGIFGFGGAPVYVPNKFDKDLGRMRFKFTKKEDISL
jgi:hypothetical protein